MIFFSPYMITIKINSSYLMINYDWRIDFIIYKKHYFSHFIIFYAKFMSHSIFLGKEIFYNSKETFYC